ncbi:unnamed protein product [Candida verbasci]|uniref:Uncharacterized protein n=1 Tax=Candida verbasci TaxID=1227364 RepID=A0A9W4TS90_9ASCO|nr:unnamed protein product [Candida verbasci]
MFSLKLSRSIEKSKFYRSFSLTNWFKSWKDAAQSQRLIYPPPHSQFTTKNRIIDIYINEKQELYPYLNVKQPLLLHFTYATQQNNKVTKALFDVLSDANKYPFGDQENKSVYLVNILCDSQGGRELILDYVVGSKIPCVLVLKHQLPTGQRFIPNVENFNEQDVIEWLRTI